VSVSPVPTSSTTSAAATSASCPHCGARVAADQRYCLSCGRACSPVRLAFLDVLQSEHATPQLTPGGGEVLAGSGAVLPPTLTYLPAGEPDGPRNWLQRHSGLLGLLSALLLAGLIGLLVGHWIDGEKSPSGAQVVKVEYPNGAPAVAGAAAAAPSSAASASKPTAKASKAAPSGPETQASEEKEAQEAQTQAKALPKPVVKSQNDLKRFESSTGKKHVEEANKLANSTEPIETGH